MSEERGYNGWTNYETWNIALWMGNEEGSYHYWDEQAQRAYDGAEADKTFTREEQVTFALAEQIKTEYNDAAQDVLEQGKVQASWISDLLGAALSEVNWHEIAEHLIEEVEKEVEIKD